MMVKVARPFLIDIPFQKLGYKGKWLKYHIYIYIYNRKYIMQSVPIATDVVSSNLDQGEVYNAM